MVLNKFQAHFAWKKCIKLKKSSKSIPAVPIDSKFYGGFESDSPRIDLYSKIISVVEKNGVEMGVKERCQKGYLLLPYDLCFLQKHICLRKNRLITQRAITPQAI